MIGPLRVIEVSPTTVTFDKDGIRHTVSVDCATIAPGVRETTAEDSRTQDDETNAGRGERHAKDTSMEEQNETNALRQYAADGIARHVGEGNNVKYVIAWYRYSPADDMVEPPVLVLKHVITRNWRQARKKNGGQQP